MTSMTRTTSTKLSTPTRSWAAGIGCAFPLASATPIARVVPCFVLHVATAAAASGAITSARSSVDRHASSSISEWRFQVTHHICESVTELLRLIVAACTRRCVAAFIGIVFAVQTTLKCFVSLHRCGVIEQNVVWCMISLTCGCDSLSVASFFLLCFGLYS